MFNKIAVALISIGIICVIAAGSLYAYNRYEDAQAGQEAAENLEVIKAWIDGENVPLDNVQESLPVASEATESVEATEETEEVVISFTAEDFIGYIEIPSLYLTLPVLSQWNYSYLNYAPCRQFGAVETHDLVIAAHNFSSHFGRLKLLSAGNTVVFTAMDGTVYNYTVELVEEIASTDSDMVQNSDYDLVLYTCTIGGENRVAVFCSETQS